MPFPAFWEKIHRILKGTKMSLKNSKVTLFGHLHAII
jgi:hypothetical protein